MPEKDGSLISIITQVDLPNMVSTVQNFVSVSGTTIV